MFVARYQRDWARFEELLGKASSASRLSGEEVDELVELYQRTATHLSMVQSTTRDAVLIGRLSSLVARGRSVVTGTRRGALRDAVRFLTVDFPAVLYRARYWWVGVTVVFVLVTVAWTAYLVHHPELRAQMVSSEEARQLVDHDFRDYYSSAPAHDFALKVFTNNAFIAAMTIASGLLLGFPVVYVLLQNALSIGAVASLMVAAHKTGLFFGLILPHGLLELTTIWVSAGLGLKLGWSAIDPGRRTRSEALAQEGRALITGALGTTLLLLISGLIEAFVTPSGLPTWARIGIGATAELGFLFLVFGLGRRAFRAGVTGDLDRSRAGDTLPTSG